MSFSRTLTFRVIAFLGLTFITGCGRETTCSGFIPSSEQKGQPGVGIINVSIDGSGSMKGFSAVADSTYQTTLEELDNTLGINSALGFSRSTTRVWRIGREAKPSNTISHRSASILAARSADFFEPKPGSWPKVSSMIDRFVDQNSQSLDILVTDLEPDNASIKQVVSAILPKLRSTQQINGFLPWQKRTLIGNELAVIGIKSQFSGGVFPVVAGNFSSFQYTGNRPFYVIALGSADKVEAIIGRLTQNTRLQPHIQITRFASDPNSGKTVFISQSRSLLATPNCMSPVASIGQGLSGKLRLQDPRQRWLMAQRINRCTAANLEIRFGTDNITGFGPKTITDTASFTSNAIDIKSASLSNKGLSLLTQFASAPRTINMIRIGADASKIDQAIWSDWNTSGTLMEGDKTQRLLAFLQSLRDETDQEAKKEYGIQYSPVRICAAIKG
jgi:hypothetical protein